MVTHFDAKDRAEALHWTSQGLSAREAVDIINLGRKEYVFFMLPLSFLYLNSLGKRLVNARWVQRVVKDSKSPTAVKAKGGRPKKLTPQQARLLLRYKSNLPQCFPPFLICFPRKAKAHPKWTLKEVLKAIPLEIPEQTARDYLHREGLYGRRPCKKPLISGTNRLRRVQWAKRWGQFDFKDVLFTDEKKWVCQGKGGQFVWRPIGMKYHPKYSQPVRQAGGGSVMVWGAICRTHTYPLIRVENTLTGVGYANLLKGFFRQHVRRGQQGATASHPSSASRASRPRLPWTFQQDNAPVHRANVVENLLRKYRGQVLPWPAQSPDLSPIENLWAYVSQRIRNQNFSHPDQLFAAVQQEWLAVPPDVLANLYASMPNRLTLVKQSKGYPIRY